MDDGFSGVRRVLRYEIHRLLRRTETAREAKGTYVFWDWGKRVGEAREDYSEPAKERMTCPKSS